MALIGEIESHATVAEKFNQDEQRVNWHDQALWALRHKRDLAAQSLGGQTWEQLRTLGSQIKAHTLANLAHYLQEFEANCLKNGIVVHWALDAEQHNQIIYDLLAAHGAKKLVKSKSMLTEECHLNPYLLERGIEVIDTDLGERIIQLNEQPPSHIVVPAIHLKKEEVGAIFHQKIGSEAGASDPTYLTKQAREHLRVHFLSADAGLTGVNMAVASEGAVVVCTNEGNADMGVNLPKLQIHSMGIDKIVPNLEAVGVLTRTLARNATGQPSTTYTSFYQGPKAGGEMHVVLVDNGRSKLLQDPMLSQTYKCIRCGGCLNTCPVYRRSSGFSYNGLIPGPIGIAVGASQDETHSMAWACTLCGSCTQVCPVKVPLDQIIHRWRKILAEEGKLPYGKEKMMPLMGNVMGRERLFSTGMGIARGALRILPHSMMKPFGGNWSKYRELPQVAESGSFEQWFATHRKQLDEGEGS